MRVFVTGATGYIGFNVASALRRAGHQVWGLARGREKADLLARNEIHPVIGSMQEPETYLRAASQCSVLIHAAADYTADTFALDGKTVEALLSTAAKGALPKSLIYTSGVWVFGNTGNNLVDETSPLRPPKFIEPRVRTEELVLQADTIRGTVLRPGCVYGRQGGLTGAWFAGAAGGDLKVVGDGNNRWAMVHVDDLAEAYLLLAESELAGEDFNIVDGSRYTVRDLAASAACAAGFTGKIEYLPVKEAAKQMGGFAEGLALDQHVDGRKADRFLGWIPSHIGFVDEARTYFESWKAARG